MASEERTENYSSGPTPPPQSIPTPVSEVSQISQILSGWGNRIKDVFGVLDEETKEMSKKRMLICNTCYMRSGNTCDPRKSMKNNITGEIARGCGCNISAKSMSPASKCPLDRWDK